MDLEFVLGVLLSVVFAVGLLLVLLLVRLDDREALVSPFCHFCELVEVYRAHHVLFLEEYLDLALVDPEDEAGQLAQGVGVLLVVQGVFHEFHGGGGSGQQDIEASEQVGELLGVQEGEVVSAFGVFSVDEHGEQTHVQRVGVALQRVEAGGHQVHVAQEVRAGHDVFEDIELVLSEGAENGHHAELRQARLPFSSARS